MAFWNRTKIVATIGPASRSRTVLRAMLRAGVDVVRINGAHGNLEEHKKTIALIRGVSRSEGLPTAILFDLPGPKMRIGTLKREPLTLKKGQTVTLACGKTIQVGDEIPVPDKFIARSVKRESQIYINDGIVEVRVKNVSGNRIECRVVSGGEIRSRKGLNLPRVRLPIPSLTGHDRELLSMAAGGGVDYIGLSFVRSARNIIDLHNILRRKAPRIGIIAKIEKPEALDDLDRIIEVSDAVMVARGDLGIEMPFDEIPLIQKMILEKCLSAGKPTITATQMMESMVNSARPTRAEAADVAMAVWEGTDAVMLSEETSIGQNPEKAVKAMFRVASEAEKSIHDRIIPRVRRDRNEHQAQVISLAAGMVADELGAKVLVTPTRSGRTALFVSSMRPHTRIVAPTGDERTARRMNLYWGVRPMKMPKSRTVDELLHHAGKAAIQSRLIKKGDSIVIISGAHGGKDDITRLIEVRRV